MLAYKKVKYIYYFFKLSQINVHSLVQQTRFILLLYI